MQRDSGSRANFRGETVKPAPRQTPDAFAELRGAEGGRGGGGGGGAPPIRPPALPPPPPPPPPTRARAPPSPPPPPSSRPEALSHPTL